MKRKNCMAGALMIMAAGWSCPAHGQTWSDAVKDMLSQPQTRTRVVNGNQQQLFADIDSRRARIGNELDAALLHGTISNAQGAVYGERLDAVTQLEARAKRSGSIDFETISFINGRLGALSGGLNNAIALNGASKHDDIARVAQAKQTDVSTLETMRDRFSTRLHEALTAGKISRSQYTAMSADLDAVHDHLLIGKGDNSAQLKLRGDLLKLERRLSDSIAGVPDTYPL